MASTQFTRTLTFQARDLGKDASLLLVFTPLDDSSLWTDLKPIAWKVIEFPQDGPQTATVTYTNRLCYMVPQISDGNIVTPSTWVPLNIGEETTLTKSGKGYHFTDAASITTGGQNLVARNKTGEKVNIGIGFMNKSGGITTPTLVYPNVGDGSMTKCQYTPVLSAYITSDYQQTELLRGDIESGVIWHKNLAHLNPSTTFNLSMNSGGKYTITEAE